jgi:hypothetical protein
VSYPCTGELAEKQGRRTLLAADVSSDGVSITLAKFYIR